MTKTMYTLEDARGNRVYGWFDSKEKIIELAENDSDLDVSADYYIVSATEEELYNNMMANQISSRYL